jgi:hypothetical protein
VPERRFRMSVLTLEGWVEGWQVRVREEAALPDKAKVYVVVPGAKQEVPCVWSPRLADPAEVSQLEMKVTELPKDRPHVEV